MVTSHVYTVWMYDGGRPYRLLSIWMHLWEAEVEIERLHKEVFQGVAYREDLRIEKWPLQEKT